MNLYQRSFLKLLDFTSAEVIALLDLAAQLKSDKKNHTETQYLIRELYHTCSRIVSI